MAQPTTQRVDCEPAFVLHSRPYRETSVLLDVLTQQHGKVSLIARGVRQARSKWRGILQPFVPLLASWAGKSQLMTLKSAEMLGPPLPLTGKGLLSGLYANELLVKLLYAGDAQVEIFSAYQRLLKNLPDTQLLTAELRIFEITMLQALGVAPQFHLDAQTGEDIDAQAFYHWVAGEGFIRLPDHVQHSSAFPGKALLALHQQTLFDIADTTQRACKRLMRMILQSALEGRQVQSRALFMLPNLQEEDER